MRERLIAAFIGLAVAVVLLYGIPRAYLLANMITEQETTKAGRAAELFALVVEERSARDEPTTQEFLERHLSPGSNLEYVDPSGDVVRAGPARADDDLVASRPVAGGGTVTLSRSSEVVDQRISEALLPLVLIGLGLLVVAGTVGYLMARRLSRPFGELAQAAEHLGRGRFDVHFPHYRVPEAEAIGEALRRASSQLDELVQREREFASNASHQLRTPITALRLQLEDLSMWSQTPPEVAEELQSYLSELDRLSGSITEILELARGRRLGDAVEVDLDELLGDVAERWRRQAEAAGRVLVHQEGRTAPVHVVPGPVIQVLDVLIENACSHGRGRITLATRERADLVAILVGDEGPRTIDDGVFRRGHSTPGGDGHGLGLAIASDLAASMGGRLSLLDEPTTTFALALPRADAGRRPATQAASGDGTD
ncbi:ATP-binding protein [Nocardioides campestrisoli]|uniref:ATP-binding protein n=1 Tax=Nocardioides campestrisoli TaxID=2736757 RepID=UPI0015E78AF8|nr:histidine kinase dimerization/phospho-acceptor domain-containing protein [Nocardioides campestrisoli]